MELDVKLWDRIKGWRPRRAAPVALNLRAKPRQIVCPCCQRTVTAWKRYADGRQECLICPGRRRK